MNIYELADILDVDLDITRFPNQDNRFICKFKDTEIKQGSMLIGEYGQGRNPHSAIDNYSQLIKGQTLVFNACGPKRREFKVPKDLTTS